MVEAGEEIALIRWYPGMRHLDSKANRGTVSVLTVSSAPQSIATLSGDRIRPLL